MLWTLKLIYRVLTISDELLYSYPYYADDFDFNPYDRVLGPASYDRVLGTPPYDRVLGTPPYDRVLATPLYDSYDGDPLLSSPYGGRRNRIKGDPLLEATLLNPRLPQVLGPIS